LLAIILAMVPSSTMETASAFARPFCGGVRLAAAEVGASGAGYARAIGCATNVRARCDSPVTAWPLRSFVVRGDDVVVAGNGASPGTYGCSVDSDQGLAHFLVTVL